MSDTFRALVIRNQDGKSISQVEQLNPTDLPEGDVLVKVAYSSINYKDAMAVTGTGKIIRKFPMVPGIDLAGSVIESSDSRYKSGDEVILTGWSVGEQYWGGYSQIQRLKADWLLPKQTELSTSQTMTIGTAGLTAMLSVMALEQTCITPSHGPILVSGARGGVGSVAIIILSTLGYQVTALTREVTPDSERYLHHLGATSVIGGIDWTATPKPLEAQKWAGAIDTVGGNVLARILAETNYQGAVAACGLAGGFQLPTTVMPFILRGVKLLGVDSVMCPNPIRSQAWRRCATDINFSKLNDIQRVVGLEKISEIAAEMMAGRSLGRVLVDLTK